MKTGKVEEERKERGLEQREAFSAWTSSLRENSEDDIGDDVIAGQLDPACPLPPPARCPLPSLPTHHPFSFSLTPTPPSHSFPFFFTDSCNVMSFKMCLFSSLMTHRQVSTWFPTRPRLKQVLDPSQQQFDTHATTMCVVQPCLSETLNKN